MELIISSGLLGNIWGRIGLVKNLLIGNKGENRLFSWTNGEYGMVQRDRCVYFKGLSNKIYQLNHAICHYKNNEPVQDVTYGWGVVAEEKSCDPDISSLARRLLSSDPTRPSFSCSSCPAFCFDSGLCLSSC